MSRRQRAVKMVCVAILAKATRQASILSPKIHHVEFPAIFSAVF